MGINFKLFLLLGTIISLAMAALFLSTSREVRILATRLDIQSSIPAVQIELLERAYTEGGWEQIQATLNRNEFDSRFHQWIVVSPDQQQIAWSNEDFSVTGISHEDEMTQFELLQLDSQQSLSLMVSPDQKTPLIIEGKQVATIYQLLSVSGRIALGGLSSDAHIVRLDLGGGGDLIDTQQLERLFSPNKTNSRILLYSIGIGLLALCGGVLFGSQITRPLKNLVAGTRRIEAGDYGHTLKVSSKDEIGDLTTSFNAMSLSLQHNADLRKRLIADIAHELRTPVTGLRCQLEALEDGVTEFSPQQLQDLLADTIQLQQLIEDLRELNLAEDRKLHIEKTHCVLQDVVESAERACNLQEKKLRLELNVPSDALTVFTDALRLRQVLVNLLANAINHSPDNGVIWIDVERQTSPDDGVLITVRDQGPGIPENELENVFERFYRVDEHRNRDAGGSGLGLAITRELMQLLGGEVFATLPAEGGTQMNVVLAAAN